MSSRSQPPKASTSKRQIGATPPPESHYATPALTSPSVSTSLAPASERESSVGASSSIRGFSPSPAPSQLSFTSSVGLGKRKRSVSSGVSPSGEGSVRAKRAKLNAREKGEKRQIKRERNRAVERALREAITSGRINASTVTQGTIDAIAEGAGRKWDKLEAKRLERVTRRINRQWEEQLAEMEDEERGEAAEDGGAGESAHEEEDELWDEE